MLYRISRQEGIVFFASLLLNYFNRNRHCSIPYLVIPVNVNRDYKNDLNLKQDLIRQRHAIIKKDVKVVQKEGEILKKSFIKKF